MEARVDHKNHRALKNPLLDWSYCGLQELAACYTTAPRTGRLRFGSELGLQLGLSQVHQGHEMGGNRFTPTSRHNDFLDF